MNNCSLLNSLCDGRLPSEFVDSHHIHIIIRKGELHFSDGNREFTARKDDLVIWQMSNNIQQVSYSDDFEADFLIASGDFLARYNPEMVWASKGFIFIRINPCFHLHEDSLTLMNNDFALFRNRLSLPETPFKEEVVGRVMQIFLYDLWTVYSAERLRVGEFYSGMMTQVETSDNAARIFLRFLTIVQADSRKQRDVAYYADKLCITPKYLSQISKSVSGLPASEWITFYATFELVSLLNDQSKTLSEVADLMNFETASHFSRYAKKLLGKSPSEYRNK